jgi:mono/diheme cytochrome c family protein
MKNRFFWAMLVVIAGTGVWLFAPPSVPEHRIAMNPAAIERGRYLIHAGGCISCHQGAAGGLSGGLAIESPFGTFYASNITPDTATGIGGWNGSDFIRALKHGRSPSGSFYYPAFPYRSYAAITDADALDIGAWLMAQPAVNHTVRDHDLPAWVMRWQMAGWNRLADWSEPEFPAYTDPQIARGAYLSRHLGHCGECHSPRNSLGLVQFDREFSGGDMADGHVKGIDAQAMTRWSEEDLALFLFLGLKPDGEFVGGKMEPVIEHNTGRLSDEDRQAMAAFFKRGL